MGMAAMSEPATMQKRIDDLETALARLTPNEQKVLRALAKYELCSDEILRFAMHGDSLRGKHIVEVIIFRMRQKLKPFGITISTLRSHGYSLDKESRDRIIGGIP